MASRQSSAAYICSSLSGVLLASGLCTSAWAQTGPSLDFIPNYVGLGLGTTTRYTGASERVAGIAPGARYQLDNAGRYIQLTGPEVSLNLLAGETWQFGPALNLRFGRTNVEDPVVSRLPEIDTTVEAGAFFSWTHISSGPLPIRTRLGVAVFHDVGNVSKGNTATIGGSAWMPISQNTIIGWGGGLSWGSSAFMRTYYGIDAAGAAASGLPAYQPSGGIRQWFAWPAIVHRLDAHWLIGLGLVYQSIEGSAADSPIVTERGKRGQLSYGLGVGYAW
ncbi:MipA/OmpV family protein [Variovorax sp. HJSM1_2]|uniref:MipA/OmpV family protein n=1 Tax=Variovorax sp. HJSM1_2 TaxID=3366263 RepID=UPI003BC55B65